MQKFPCDSQKIKFEEQLAQFTSEKNRISVNFSLRDREWVERRRQINFENWLWSETVLYAQWNALWNFVDAEPTGFLFCFLFILCLAFSLQFRYLVEWLMDSGNSIFCCLCDVTLAFIDNGELYVRQNWHMTRLDPLHTNAKPKRGEQKPEDPAWKRLESEIAVSNISMEFLCLVATHLSHHSTR